MAVGKNLSSFLSVPVPPTDADRGRIMPSIRGFRPLSSTFFLALMLTQSTSCFIASRSDTLRRGTVRRSVLVRGRTPCGVDA